MDLQFRSTETGDLYTAMAKFNSEYPNLAPDKKSFRNEYVSYHTAMQAVRPILAQCGLSITSGLRNVGGKEYFITSIVHSSGQWESYSTLIELKEREDLKQVLGERKRTQIFSILGITNYKEDAPLTGFSVSSGRVFDNKKVLDTIKTISFDQIKSLSESIGNRNELTVKILKKLNVNSLDKIPEKKFVNILAYVKDNK